MKVLLPVDGTPCAQTTLAWASQFLNKEQTSLYLLYVVENIPEVPITEYEIEFAQTSLKQAKQYLQEQGFHVAESSYVVDMASRAICLYAEEQGIDQVIMGSHGRQGLAKFLMGSVSETVFRTANCPVLIINNQVKHDANKKHSDEPVATLPVS